MKNLKQYVSIELFYISNNDRIGYETVGVGGFFMFLNFRLMKTLLCH